MTNIHKLYFKDQGRPQIGTGYRSVEVKVGRHFVEMRDADHPKRARWKKFTRRTVLEYWPEVFDG